MEGFDPYTPISTGTSIGAAIYKDGVCLVADCKTTAGQMVSSRASDKITKITDNIYCLRSGSAADTQTVSRYTNHYLNYLSLQTNHMPSVKVAAHILSKMIYANKDFLTASVMIAGYDETGPHIYAIEIDGCVSEEPWMLSGSGTTFVFGMMDEFYRPNMSKDEIRQLMGTLIKRSIGRDSKSGGFVRIVTIDRNGVEKKYLPYDTVPV